MTNVDRKGSLMAGKFSIGDDGDGRNARRRGRGRRAHIGYWERFGQAVSIRVHATDLRDERVPFVLQLTNGRTLTDIYVDWLYEFYSQC